MHCRARDGKLISPASLAFAERPSPNPILRWRKMAQRVEVVLIDDIDGGNAAETVTFALDGVTYEIDLSEENARKLRDDFATWTGHARRAGTAKAASRRRAGAGSGAAKRTDLAAVREWARANGHDVSDPGGEVAVARDALEDLVGRQLRELAPLGAGLDLVPRAWRGHGRALTPAQRVGADRCLGSDVLTPVEEDLAGPQLLGHLPHDEVGVGLGQLLCELLDGVADLVARVRSGQHGIQLESLAAARHRHGVEPDATEPLAHDERDARALVQPGAGPGVEVDDAPVGTPRLRVAPLPLVAPLVHVQLEGVEVGEVRQSRQVVDEREDGVAPGAADPRRRARGDVLLEELHATDPVREADPCDGAVAQVRQDHRRDARVVVDHLGLGRAGAGIHHLLEARQLHPPAVDLDRDLAGLVGHHSPPAWSSTSPGVRSLRRPLYAGWRSLPSPLSPSDCTSATRTGFTEVAPAESSTGTSGAKGDSVAVSDSRSRIRACPVLPARPEPTRPR